MFAGQTCSALARRLVAPLVVALFSVSNLPAAEPSDPLLQDYYELLEWRFSAAPLTLSAEGLHWQLDTAAWHLDSGRLWLQRPTHDGRLTGLVFEGSGRFEMSVPDPVELRQLRRFAKDAELAALSETFDALVLRGVDLAPLAKLSPPTATHYATHPLARSRHDHWLTIRRFDADSRVVAALGRSQDAYLRVDMRTDERGWLTYDYDARRPEEIVVEWFNPAYKALESWLSLDRAADRDSRGRPTSIYRPSIDVEHLEVTADLTRSAKESPQGVAKARPVDATIRTVIRFEALTEGDRSLQLYLHPWAKIERIENEDGHELGFVRDHLGKRSSAIEKRVYDDSLLVLLDQPLMRGERRSMAVSYELEMPGYALGRVWHPTAVPTGSGIPDLFTAHLTLVCRPDFAVRAMGRLEDERQGDNLSTSTWVVDRPVKMVTFVFARRPYEERLPGEGSPHVSAFGSLGGFMSKSRVRETGSDVADSVVFFQELFDSPVSAAELIAGVIPSSHGQAFEGLVHIGDFSVLSDRVAERELFRSHEVAHLWWGHKVGWRGYRDQWLSEGFAEYSAMMFVEATLEKGPKYFEEMLKAFTDELTGSIESSFSQFSRPGIPLLNRRAEERIGPVGHGRRSAVGEAPTAYLSQAYKKGALALHSLRMILRARTGSDQAFIDTLQAFIERYDGRTATTADFEAVLQEVVPGPWSWFFDSWVYSAEIPTYVWSHDVVAAEDEYVLRLKVKQREVDPDFTMTVPIEIEYPGGEATTVLVTVDQPSKDFEFALERRPRKVTFNPDYAVLARVKAK